MSKDVKAYTIAGTSTFRGENTYRFASGSNPRTRALVLLRNHHIDVDLLLLPRAMNKTDAIEYLKTQGKEANMPKTGRGSGLTPEQIAAQETIIAEKQAAELAEAGAVAEADSKFLDEILGQQS